MIDDHPIVLTTLEFVLEDLGYFVRSASDGDQGLKIIKRGGVDLILLDLDIPVLNGFVVLKWLQDNLPYGAIPVIAITGSYGIDGQNRALAAGACEILTKPFSFANLETLLAKHLLPFNVGASHSVMNSGR